MQNTLVAIALFAILWVGFQELDGVARGLLVVAITGAVGLLLPGDPEPGDNSGESGDDTDGVGDD